MEKTQLIYSVSCLNLGGLGALLGGVKPPKKPCGDETDPFLCGGMITSVCQSIGPFYIARPLDTYELVKEFLLCSRL